MIAKFENINTALVVPTSDNARAKINKKDTDFLQLKDQIKACGIIVPLIVRGPLADGTFDLRAGYRRHTAATMLKLETVPALVYPASTTDAEAHTMTIIENSSRVDLSPSERIEEIWRLSQLTNDDVKGIACLLAMPEHQVRLAINAKKGLTPDWQKAMTKPKGIFARLTLEHLGLIARLNKQQQDEVFDWDKYEWSDRTSDESFFTVEELKAALNAKYTYSLTGVAWDLDVADIGGRPTCKGCDKRSDCDAQKDLFSDLNLAASKKIKAGVSCLDPFCFADKIKGMAIANIAKLKEKHADIEVRVEYQGGSSRQDLVDAVGKQGMKTHNNYQSNPAKNTDEGAIPVAVLNSNTGEVKVEYRKPHTSSSVKSELDGPKPLKKRKAELENRRWFAVKDIFIEWLKKQKEWTIVNLDKVDLHASFEKNHFTFFGSIVSCLGDGGACDWRWKLGWHDIASITMIEATDTLWIYVRALLVNRASSDVSTLVYEKKMREGLEWVANLVDYDLEATYAEVIVSKGYTVPKSWGKLEADDSKKEGPAPF